MTFRRFSSAFSSSARRARGRGGALPDRRLKAGATRRGEHLAVLPEPLPGDLGHAVREPRLAEICRSGFWGILRIRLSHLRHSCVNVRRSRGGHLMPLIRRIDVIAVCAAFVFLGAIVFGLL